jgi:hypothetical protein
MGSNGLIVAAPAATVQEKRGPAWHPGDGPCARRPGWHVHGLAWTWRRWHWSGRTPVCPQCLIGRPGRTWSGPGAARRDAGERRSKAVESGYPSRPHVGASMSTQSRGHATPPGAAQPDVGGVLAAPIRVVPGPHLAAVRAHDLGPLPTRPCRTGVPSAVEVRCPVPEGVHRGKVRIIAFPRAEWVMMPGL